MPVVPLNAVIQVWVLGLVPPELGLLLQGLTNGRAHVCDLVGFVLGAEDPVEGHLQSDGSCRLRLDGLQVLMDDGKILAVVTSVDPVEGSLDELTDGSHRSFDAGGSIDGCGGIAALLHLSGVFKKLFSPVGNCTLLKCDLLLRESR